MACYKYSQFFKQSASAVYDTLLEPGVQAPHAGIYRCSHCGREIGIAHDHTLPPQDHHTHPRSSGRIQWQLVAYAGYEG